jgi:hypothetical protein
MSGAIAAVPLFLGKLPRWAWFAIGGVLLLVAFYLALNAYGNSRYKAGKADADAAWIAASDKLIQKAQSAGTKADKAAAARQADFAAKQEDEKERIDAAQAKGSSPFDVLFNADGR